MQLIEVLGSDRDMVVDDADYDRMASVRWRFSPKSHRYPYGHPTGSCTVLAHRFLLAHELAKYPRAVTDHINGDPFDNRRNNLRVTSQSVNILNNHRPRSDNKSGVIGVHFFKGRWVAFLGRQYLGRFITLEAAALAREKALRYAIPES